ncbi:MAG: helix-turn-helix domain-containing protein [Thermoproteota archaeon]
MEEIILLEEAAKRFPFFPPALVYHLVRLGVLPEVPQQRDGIASKPSIPLSRFLEIADLLNPYPHHHLLGQSISFREAARRYGLSHTSFYRWLKKGYIYSHPNGGMEALSAHYAAQLALLVSPRRGKKIFPKNFTPPIPNPFPAPLSTASDIDY